MSDSTRCAAASAACWRSLGDPSTFSASLPCRAFAGDPIAGPSAVDALAGGAAFLNPTFDTPRAGFFTSQHPFLSEHVGAPYVCDFRWEAPETLAACARAALDGPPLAPVIPAALSEAAHAARVRDIFGPLLLPQPQQA